MRRWVQGMWHRDTISKPHELQPCVSARPCRPHNALAVASERRQASRQPAACGLTCRAESKSSAAPGPCCCMNEYAPLAGADPSSGESRSKASLAAGTGSCAGAPCSSAGSESAAVAAEGRLSCPWLVPEACHGCAAGWAACHGAEESGAALAAGRDVPGCWLAGGSEKLLLPVVWKGAALGCSHAVAAEATAGLLAAASSSKKEPASASAGAAGCQGRAPGAALWPSRGSCCAGACSARCGWSCGCVVLCCCCWSPSCSQGAAGCSQGAAAVGPGGLGSGCSQGAAWWGQDAAACCSSGGAGASATCCSAESQGAAACSQAAAAAGASAAAVAPSGCSQGTAAAGAAGPASSQGAAASVH